MANNRKFLLGSATAAALGAALLCGAGAAAAQDYGYENDAYRPAQGESVIIRPNRHPLGVILRNQRLGDSARSGSLFSEELSLSEAVDYSDLDLARVSDRRELQSRIRDTAQNICATLDAQDRMYSDAATTRECVRTAIRGAQSQIPEG